MHIINITVRDKIATHVGDAYYVCGNSDFVVHFDFDEEWDALDVKTARFIREDGAYHDQVFSGSECPVPIISNTNNVRVGVFAGNLCTTTPARVPAAKSILCPGGVPAAPGDDVYNQIMEEVNETRGATNETAQALQEACGEGGLYLVTCFVHASDNEWHANRTQEEIRAAVAAKKTCLLSIRGKVYTYLDEQNNNSGESCPTFVRPGYYVSGQGIALETLKVEADGKIHISYPGVSRTPNPRSLTIKQGDKSTTYNGSSAVTVEVEGGEAVQADMAQDSVIAPDYVKNRTHYDLTAQSYPTGTKIPEGAAAAQLMQDGAASGWRMVKVSDVTPAAADLVENAHCQVTTGSTTGSKVTAENIAGETPAGYIVAAVARLGSGNVYQIRAAVCFEAGYVAEGALSVNIKGLTATLPEPGLYMLARDGEAVTYGGLTWQGHTHALPDRFIPSTVLRKAELPDMPTDEHIRGLADERLSLFGRAACLPEIVHAGSSTLTLEAPWAVEIHAGKDYIVVHNGKAHRLTAINITDNAVGAVLLGNGRDNGLTDLNPDVPFAVAAVSNAVGAQTGMYGVISIYDDVTPFSVAIYETSRAGYYYYDGDAARLVDIKELRQALIDAGKSVTILEETTVQGEGGEMLLLTPLAAVPEDGVTYKVTYNGTAYDCPALAYAVDGMAGVALGNTDAMGLPGGNADAPFVVMLVPGGTDMGDGTMVYGMVMDMTGASSATVSIVEAASGPEYMTREQVVALINEMMGGN